MAGGGDGGLGTSSSSTAPVLPRLPARRSAHAHSAAAGALSARERRKTILEMLDEEIVQLRPRAAAQAEHCKEIRKELIAARVVEQHEVKTLTANRDNRKARAQDLAKRMQALVRGFLVRRRVCNAITKEIEAGKGFGARLPGQLREQLRDLRHTMHDLTYRGEHREMSIVHLQAFWRGVLGRRLARVLRLARSMREVYARMNAAATRLSTWFRSVSTRLRYRDKIEDKLRVTFTRQMGDMLEGLTVVIKLQRAFRVRLARKMVFQRRHNVALEAGIDPRLLMPRPEDPLAEAEGAEAPMQTVDCWRPGGIGGASSDAEGVLSPTAMQRDPSLIRSDRELRRLEEVGLTPFYWSASTELVRHRLGGPEALQMARRLGGGEAKPEPSWSWSTDAAEGGPAAPGPQAWHWQAELPQDSGASLGRLWDVYPEGLSRDFISKLDEDAWPWPRKAAKRQKQQTRRPPKRPPPQQPPPANAHRRALARDEAAAAAPDAEMLEQHPLFANAPPPAPTAPAPPKVLPSGVGLRARPRPRPWLAGAAVAARRAAEEGDEVSWEGARSFFHCPSEARGKLPKLPGGDRGAASLDATAGPQLALAW